MYKKLSSILFPIVTIMLIVAVYWGFQQQKLKNDVMVKAENQYQRAYGNLTYYLGQLDEQMGQTLAISSTSNHYYRKGLINVWRLTSEAQQQIGQLPTNYIPFNDAETFLTRVANFSYKAAVRDLETEPLTDGELSTLNELYNNAKSIRTTLGDLQGHISRAGLRWVDVELALADDNEAIHNPVIATLKDMNSEIKAYPEIDWGPAVNSMYEDDNIKLLSGDLITEEEAIKKAGQFLKKDMTNAEVIENGSESSFPTISINIDNYNVTYAKKGGLLVSYSFNKEVSGKTISKEEAIDKAEDFLEEHNYEELEAVAYNENNSFATIIFVAEQDDVLIYPDKISVRMALDNGDVIGLQASEFAAHHRKREIKKPTISETKAKQALSKQFILDDTDLAIIKSDLGDEVLCYQFEGELDNKKLRIFINATNGREEKFERIN